MQHQSKYTCLACFLQPKEKSFMVAGLALSPMFWESEATIDVISLFPCEMLTCVIPPWTLSLYSWLEVLIWDITADSISCSLCCGRFGIPLRNVKPLIYSASSAAGSMLIGLVACRWAAVQQWQWFNKWLCDVRQQTEARSISRKGLVCHGATSPSYTHLVSTVEVTFECKGKLFTWLKLRPWTKLPCNCYISL